MNVDWGIVIVLSIMLAMLLLMYPLTLQSKARGGK